MSWDGNQRAEGRKYINRGGWCNGYVSFVRKDGVLTLYESNNEPKDGDVTKVMTKRHTWSTKNVNPLRLGVFLHDQSDFFEVYPRGTSVKVKQ